MSLIYGGSPHVRAQRQQRTREMQQLTALFEEHKIEVEEYLIRTESTMGGHDENIETFWSDECFEYCPLHGHDTLTNNTDELSCQQALKAPSVDAQATKLFTSINYWQTRLLKLQPGSFGEKAKAELCTVDLVHGSGAIHHGQQVRIQYEALSYVWGDATPTQSIELNGVLHPTAANLHSALQRLRLRDRERWIWIDALCINQQDAAERAMQVSNMLLIYQKAEKVLVWLGEQQLHTVPVATCFTSVNPKICNQHSDIVCEGLVELLCRDWFRRLWVKQEVWAANEILMICGSCVVSWDIFEIRVNQLFKNLEHCQKMERRLHGDETRVDEEAELPGHGTGPPDWKRPKAKGLHAWFSDLQNPLPGLRRASRSQRALISVLGREREGVEALLRPSTGLLNPIRDESDLLKVLIRTSKAECSDLRDHVYAVLGMTNVSHGWSSNSSAARFPAIVVNYNLSIAQVYQDVIRYYINRDHSLWILNALLDDVYHCRRLTLGGVVRNEKLPNWCPNWSLALDLHEDACNTDKARWGQHGQSFKLRTHCVSTSANKRDNILRLSGLVLAIVEWAEYAALMSGESNLVESWRCNLKLNSQSSTVTWLREGMREKNISKFDTRYTPRIWSLNGRAPLKDDVLVAVEGSVTPLVLRRHSEEPKFEFVGIAVKMHAEPVLKWDYGVPEDSAGWKGRAQSPHFSTQREKQGRWMSLVQLLLKSAKRHNLLETFHVV